MHFPVDIKNGHILLNEYEAMLMSTEDLPLLQVICQLQEPSCWQPVSRVWGCSKTWNFIECHADALNEPSSKVNHMHLPVGNPSPDHGVVWKRDILLNAYEAMLMPSTGLALRPTTLICLLAILLSIIELFRNVTFYWMLIKPCGYPQRTFF